MRAAMRSTSTVAASSRNQRAPRRGVGDPLRDGVVPRRRRVLRAQRMREPVPQQPAARRGGAAVEQRQQRRRRLAAQRLGDLEIAPRRGVEQQMLARGLDVERRGRAPAPTAASTPRSRTARLRRRRARSRSSTPKAARSCVPKCFASARVAAAASNCHAGSVRVGSSAVGERRCGALGHAATRRRRVVRAPRRLRTAAPRSA